MSDSQQPDVPVSDAQAAAHPRPAWAAQPTQVVWKETPPLEYHQLLRGAPRYSWWRPLLGLLVGTICYFVLSVVYTLLLMVGYTVFTGTDFLEFNLLDFAVPDTQKPFSLLLTLGSVALMLPSAVLGMLSAGLRPTGRLWSAAVKIRWGWLGRTILPAVLALFVSFAVGLLIDVTSQIWPTDSADLTATVSATSVTLDPQIMLLSSLLILLLVPIQATAEEVVFRGAFMQTIGAWGYSLRRSRSAAFFRGPVLPILIPSLLFGFAHIYDIWGWASVVAMAVALGWLTWRTGGLEAAISLHVINNWVALGFMVFAYGGQTKQTVEGGGWQALTAQIVSLAFYVWWVERSFKKSSELNTRIDYIAQREPVPVPAQETT